MKQYSILILLAVFALFLKVSEGPALEETQLSEEPEMKSYAREEQDGLVYWIALPDEIVAPPAAGEDLFVLPVTAAIDNNTWETKTLPGDNLEWEMSVIDSSGAVCLVGKGLIHVGVDTKLLPGERFARRLSPAVQNPQELPPGNCTIRMTYRWNDGAGIELSAATTIVRR
jgi:hypothetical protein